MNLLGAIAAQRDALQSEMLSREMTLIEVRSTIWASSPIGYDHAGVFFHECRERMITRGVAAHVLLAHQATRASLFTQILRHATTSRGEYRYASGKMFSANPLPSFMLASLELEPPAPRPSQARGYRIYQYKLRRNRKLGNAVGRWGCCDG